MLVNESSPEELRRSSHDTMFAGARREEGARVVMDPVLDEQRREILVAGEEAKVDLVVVDQRSTYNASCRVPVCMGCSLVLFSPD